MTLFEIEIHDFDELENRDPEVRSLGLYTHQAAVKFVSNMPPVRCYVGYDNNIYPQFKMIRREVVE